MSSSDRQHNDEESQRMNFAVPIPHAPMSSSPLAALAWSLSPPVAFNATQHRDSFGRRQELESAFYRDLFCCNKRIHNLHHLLLHYEKHHHPQSQQPMDEDNSGSAAADQQDTMDIESVDPSQQQQQHQQQQPQPQQPIQQQQPDIITTTDNTFAPIIPGTEDASEELLLFRNTGTDMQLFHADYSAVDKPYKCTVPGCLKSYKNANGLKYHREHGHLNDENDDDRPFRCTIGTCHKRYKQLSGLKYHITHAHMAPQPAFAAHFSSLQHPTDPFS